MIKQYHFISEICQKIILITVFIILEENIFLSQENILFQKHIMQNKIKEGDIIIFINGENEQGNSEIINTKFISENYNDLHQKYWKLYKSGIKYFITLMPIFSL